MLLIDPSVTDLIVKQRQRELARQIEKRRLIALARGTDRRDPSLLGRTRLALGAVLIRVGNQLQGARRTERALPPLDAAAPAALHQG